MNAYVDHFDHHAGEPADRFHPEYESFRSWLDAVAPATVEQKMRNRSRWHPPSSNVRLADLQQLRHTA